MDAKSLADDFFLNRFEPDGEGFIYRPNLRAPGVRVTSAERNHLIELYKRKHRNGMWIIVPVTILGIALLGLAEERFPVLMTPGMDWAWIVALIAIVIVVTRIQSRSEARVFGELLKDRPIVAPARSKEEARRAHFRNMTWTQIGGIGALFVAALLRTAIRNHFLVWSNRYWIAGIAILIACIFAPLAYRKWRWGLEE